MSAEKKKHAPLGKRERGMCWNAPVSFATFAIGTVLNAASFRALRGSGVAPVVWAWQYALLMQLPEGAAWLDGAAEAPARAAFLLNVTQPLAAHLAVRVARATAGGVDRGIVALVMFYALLVTDLGELVDGSRSIAAGDGCLVREEWSHPWCRWAQKSE